MSAHRPDYDGGCIVNLMASLLGAFGADSRYPPLRTLAPAALDARTVVLLVIDGLGYQHLLRAPPGALGRHMRGSMTSVFPTTTATAVTAFLTGEAAQQHGLTGWYTYFAELDRIVTVLPFHARGERASLATYGTDVVRLYGHTPIFDRLDARSFVVSPAAIAHSEFNLAHAGRATIRPYTGLAELVRAIVDAAKESSERTYVYAYYGEIDRLAHEHGIASPEVAAQLAQLDVAFDDLLRDLAGTGTTIIATADHGMIDTTPDRWIALEADDRLSTMLLRPLSGEARVAYCAVRPGAHAAFRAEVAARFAHAVEIMESAELIAAGYFGVGPPHPRLRERVGDYALLMRDNYAIKDWLPGERRFTQVGVHGGLSDEELFVPLIVAQP